MTAPAEAAPIATGFAEPGAGGFETARLEAGNAGAARADGTENEAGNAEAARAEGAETEAGNAEAADFEAAKAVAAKTEATKLEADKSVVAKSAPADSPAPAPTAPTTAAPPSPKLDLRRLVRAFGGPRYAVAFAVDALGSGMLRPFLLLFGVKVLRLSAPATGGAMTVGIVAGLFVLPWVGRWVDRGARSSAVAAAMGVRVGGVALLLSASPGQVWLFVAAAFCLGVGNRAFPTAHGAVIATVATGRERDAALAAGRSLGNAGMGLGALIAAAALAGGAPALRGLAAGTGVSYLVAASLAWSVRIRAVPGAGRAGRSSPGEGEPAPRMGVLLAANVVFTFCLNVPEIALPLILATWLHASPLWAAGVFVLNTALVVTLQVPVTVWMARFSRRGALAMSGVVLTVSYLGFLAAVPLGRAWGAPVVVAVSVVCTLGEIVYAGSATPLVAAIAAPEGLGRALARFQLSTGFGLAISPTVITALGTTGPALLWGTLAIATLASAAAVAR